MIRHAILLCIGMLIVATACSRQQPSGQDASQGTPRRQAAAESQPESRPDPSLSQAAGEAQQAAADALRSQPAPAAESERR